MCSALSSFCTSGHRAFPPGVKVRVEVEITVVIQSPPRRHQTERLWIAASFSTRADTNASVKYTEAIYHNTKPGEGRRGRKEGEMQKIPSCPAPRSLPLAVCSLRLWGGCVPLPPSYLQQRSCWKTQAHPSGSKLKQSSLGRVRCCRACPTRIPIASGPSSNTPPCTRL